MTAAAIAPAARRRMSVSATSVPTLARSARLKFDETRQRWVVLVPERVLAPDDIAVQILQLCSGKRSVETIIDLLAEKYLAPRDEIDADVTTLLQDLAESGFLVDARERTG